ncbi:MAG: MGMT family protein [Gammaproteobacteria bacterium]|nr:MGMT family protein [Gammaproteobacteria bacterium]
MKTIIYPFPILKQAANQPLQLSISFSCTDFECIISEVHFVQDKSFQDKPEDSKVLDSNEQLFNQQIEKQLDAYLKDAEFQFTLACNIQLGTPFQQKVWQALTQITSGEVKTYGELAKELGSSARAVGNACRRNLFPIIIPCHRVVSASGIGGYAGDTLDDQKGEIHFLQIKQHLLEHETVVVRA